MLCFDLTQNTSSYLKNAKEIVLKEVQHGERIKAYSIGKGLHTQK